MDCILRCNQLKCRVQLSDEAVVTTCSHIFCVTCADSFGFFTPPDGSGRTCPACRTILTAADDAVHTKLNPPEDYKTSVLSGLSPAVIMECAGRALSFWSYQMTQEVVYQEWSAKALTDKFNILNSQMDKAVRDANDELHRRDAKIETLTDEIDALKQKHHGLNEAFREKTQKHRKTQELYDRLKRRSLLSQVQTAATNSVEESVLRGGIGNNDFEIRSPRPPPPFKTRQPLIHLPIDRNGVEQIHLYQRSGSAGSGTSDKRLLIRNQRQSPLRTSFTPMRGNSINTSGTNRLSQPTITGFPAMPHANTRTPLYNAELSQQGLLGQTPRQKHGQSSQNDKLPIHGVKIGRSNPKPGAFIDRASYR